MSTTGATGRPARVVVWGNGVPDGLGQRLAAVPGLDVTLVPRPHDLTFRLLRRYEVDVRVASPDLVVIASGDLEAATWLDRLRRHRDGRHGPGAWTRAWLRLLSGLLTALVQASRPGSIRRFERAIGHAVRLCRLDLGADVVLVPPAHGDADPYAAAMARVAGADTQVVALPSSSRETVVEHVASAVAHSAGGDVPSSPPLSVVVCGNSVAVMMVPGRRTRPEGTYGERLVDRLAAGGRPARLALEARWFDFAHDAAREFDDRVAPHRPDVLVLHFGTNEAQPWLVPVPLLRHLLASDRPTTPAADWYRRGPAATAWRSIRTYRRRVSPLVGQRTWQVRPGRFATAMATMARRARDEHDALVLVVDLTPPGGTLEHHLPGQQERHARVQQVLRDVVAHLDDDGVRLVSAAEVVSSLGPDAALQDGIHLSPEAHDRLARAMHAQVEAWLAARSG